MPDNRPEPPPPESEFTPTVADRRIRRLVRGVGQHIAGVRKLLEEPELRKLVTDSAEPLRFNEASQTVTQGGEPIEIKRLTSLIRCNAHDRIEVESAKIDSVTGSPLAAPLKLPREDTSDAIVLVAQQDSYDPVREYLDSLRGWPIAGSPIDYVAEHGLHLAEGIDRRIIRKWAISAVARAMSPGCKVDTVLVLVGEQSVGKSTFFSTIAGDDFFSDTAMDMSNKDRFQQLHGPWIYEWSELSSISMANLEDIKAFITSRDDRFRASYAAETTSHKRRGVIVGSTNKPNFLRDPTGERRFWPITLEQPTDLDLIQSERDNFWAEALAEYEAGMPWHFPRGDSALVELKYRHAVHREHDDWEGPVGGWAEGWAGPITTRAALTECVKIDLGRITRADQMRMSNVLTALGYKKRRVRGMGEREYVWDKITDLAQLA